MDDTTRYLGRLGGRPDLSLVHAPLRESLERAEGEGARWRFRVDRYNDEWRLHADHGDGEMLAYCPADAVESMTVLPRRTNAPV